MSLEAENFPKVALGSLRGCLVEGDAEQRAREKRVRRRSLTLSFFLQAVALAALLLLPLFGNTDPRAAPRYVPQPIFTSGGGSHSQQERRNASPRPAAVNVCRICAPLHIPPRFPTPSASSIEDSNFIGENLPPGVGNANGDIIGAIPVPGENAHGVPPLPVLPKPTSSPRVRITTLEPAMLIHRVEPVFPPLLRQIRRGARVELRAVIATDGSIQSLQIVGGDPPCYQSAVDAVRQWRYRPTILNGVPVEVETFITVIYQIR